MLLEIKIEDNRAVQAGKRSSEEEERTGISKVGEITGEVVTMAVKVVH